MGNIQNQRLLSTQDESGAARYSATLALSYGNVAASPQLVAGYSFQGNSDLFQIQSLMFGANPVPVRNIQLGFIFSGLVSDHLNGLFLFCVDTGELIPVNAPSSGANVSEVALSVNVLPTMQIQILRNQNDDTTMTGNGVVVFSTFERRPYWSQ